MQTAEALDCEKRVLDNKKETFLSDYYGDANTHLQFTKGEGIFFLFETGAEGGKYFRSASSFVDEAILIKEKLGINYAQALDLEKFPQEIFFCTEQKTWQI